MDFYTKDVFRNGETFLALVKTEPQDDAIIVPLVRTAITIVQGVLTTRAVKRQALSILHGILGVQGVQGVQDVSTFDQTMYVRACCELAPIMVSPYRTTSDITLALFLRCHRVVPYVVGRLIHYLSHRFAELGSHLYQDFCQRKLWYNFLFQGNITPFDWVCNTTRPSPWSFDPSLFNHISFDQLFPEHFHSPLSPRILTTEYNSYRRFYRTASFKESTNHKDRENVFGILKRWYDYDVAPVHLGEDDFPRAHGNILLGPSLFYRLAFHENLLLVVAESLCQVWRYAATHLSFKVCSEILHGHTTGLKKMSVGSALLRSMTWVQWIKQIQTDVTFLLGVSKGGIKEESSLDEALYVELVEEWLAAQYSMSSTAFLKTLPEPHHIRNRMHSTQQHYSVFNHPYLAYLLTQKASRNSQVYIWSQLSYETREVARKVLNNNEDFKTRRQCVLEQNMPRHLYEPDADHPLLPVNAFKKIFTLKELNSVPSQGCLDTERMVKARMTTPRKVGQTLARLHQFDPKHKKATQYAAVFAKPGRRRLPLYLLRPDLFQN
jgi:hypothetical protein